jgi:predicted amidohydrolase
MLDGDACVELAVERMRAAAADGAQLVVLPECFVPFYPKSWLTVSTGTAARPPYGSGCG